MVDWRSEIRLTPLPIFRVINRGSLHASIRGLDVTTTLVVLQLSKMTPTARVPRLTAPQLEILRVLWERSEATVVEIHRALQSERPIATTTIATLLSRLEKRGLVAYRTEGRQYVYRAVLQEQDARQHALVEVTQGIVCRRRADDGESVAVVA